MSIRRSNPYILDGIDIQGAICSRGLSLWWRDYLSDKRLIMTADSDDNDTDDSGTGVSTKIRTRTQKPNLYKVLLLNDDFTPMEFVIQVLEQFFNKGQEDATDIMLHVHQNGVGLCGVFTYEVAETKVTHVMDFARQHQHPLQCTMERE